jgi:7-cyano-7-deazaguanine synthase
MNKFLSIVLVSGGMDSCVTAAIANQGNEMAFLHVNYGQRTESRELQAFNEIADCYKVKRRLVADISYLREIGGSSLTDQKLKIEQPKPNRLKIPSTYVPFRNTHLLSIATSWAEVIGANTIFIGAVEQDSSAYPDCRPAYFKAFTKLIESGTKPDTNITIKTPIINLRKKDIILKGIELKAPLHLTWSCYKNSTRACGRCDSCALRLKGFKEAGLRDPIDYERKHDE